MSLVANRRLRVEKDVITRVTRSLLGNGNISVQVGQEIAPTEVIGTSTRSSGFRLINLSTALEVIPVEVKKYLKKQLGETIYKGELLALKKGSLLHSEKTVVAPSDGILDSVDDRTGQLRLKFLAKKESVTAAVYGVVEKVDVLRQQIIIKTQVTRIYGVAGVGKQREGILSFIEDRGGIVMLQHMSEVYQGRILVGGGLIYKDAVSSAISQGVGGIVTGGVNAADYLGMSGGDILKKKGLGTDVGISLMVTEGFGTLPIGYDIYGILREHENHFVILDGNKGVLDLPSFDPKCMIRIKSSHLSPIKGETVMEAVPAIESYDITVGQTVRVVAAPFMSEQGRVVSIDEEPTRLQSGVLAKLMTVETKTRKIVVPYRNIEIVL